MARKIKRTNANQQISQLVSRAITKRAERKNWILQTLTNTMGTAGVVINLSNGIIQGDNYNNRSGDTIRMLKQKLMVRCTGATTSSTNRFILFRDMMNTGVTPAVTDVLDAAVYIAGYNSLKTIQQRRFVIEKDWVCNNNLNGEGLTSLVHVINAPANVMYNDTTAVAAANGKGAVFILAIGSSSTAIYDISWQVDYTDS